MTLPLWVWAAVLGAIAQTGRNATQASLTTALGTVGATQVRFLFGLPFAVLFIFVAKGLAGYVQQVALSRAGNRVVSDIQRKMYRKLLQQEASWFDATDSSDLLVRVTGDTIAMSPPLIVEKAQIDTLVAKLADAIHQAN